MPWISVRLFWAKYSSQVALGTEVLQNSPQSAVGTEPLWAARDLAHTSKPRLDKVRFPSRQTLRRGVWREGAHRPFSGHWGWARQTHFCHSTLGAGKAL